MPTQQPSESRSSSSVDATQAAADAFRTDYVAVRTQIERAIVGQRDIIDGVLTCLFAGGHVLLEGAPGLGKTLLVRTLAQAVTLQFSRIQFTPDLMPADVTGATILTDTPEGRRFTFQKGPIFAQIVLADEINRATPKTQSALLEAMQERSVTVGGTTHRLDAPFFVMATQNPIEQEGTYPLPEAQLDRFFFKLLVGHTSRSELSEILNRTTAGAQEEPTSVIDGAGILKHQALARRVAAAPHVQDYAVRLTLATQPNPDGKSKESFATPMVNRFIRFGASPRAAQSIILGAKVRALLEKRAAISVDDIRAVATPALRHRMLLNFEGEAEGVTTDAIVENLLATLPVKPA